MLNKPLDTFFENDKNNFEAVDETEMTTEETQKREEDRKTFSCELAQKEYEERVADWDDNIEIIDISFENWDQWCTIVEH